MKQEPTIHLVAYSVMTHALHMIPLYNHVLTKALRHVHFPGFSSKSNVSPSLDRTEDFLLVVYVGNGKKKLLLPLVESW